VKPNPKKSSKSRQQARQRSKSTKHMQSVYTSMAYFDTLKKDCMSDANFKNEMQRLKRLKTSLNAQMNETTKKMEGMRNRKQNAKSISTHRQAPGAKDLGLGGRTLSRKSFKVPQKKKKLKKRNNQNVNESRDLLQNKSFDQFNQPDLTHYSARLPAKPKTKGMQKDNALTMTRLQQYQAEDDQKNEDASSKESKHDNSETRDKISHRTQLKNRSALNSIQPSTMIQSQR